MAKVIKITGEKSPITGIHYLYTATLESNATEEDKKKVKWQVYLKDETGNWIIHPKSPERNDTKAGAVQDYAFGELFTNQELLLTAFIERAILNEPPGLLIKPISGNPKIIKFFFTDLTGKTLEEISYNQRMMLQIHTVGMLEKSVNYSIYDDANGTKTEVRKGQSTKIIKPNGVVNPEESFMIDMPIRTGQNTSADEHHFKIKIWETGNEVNFLEQDLKIKNQMVNQMSDPETQVPITTGTSEPVKKEEKKKECACSRPITKEELKAIAIHSTQASIDKHYNGLVKAMEKFKINTCIRISHFLAQVLEESGHLQLTKEGGDEEYLSVYKGWHGRGLIQLTTEPNYKSFEKAIDDDVTSTVANRDKLLKNPYASYSAAWFFSEKAELNDDADKNDFMNIVYTVNGGFNHYDDRLESLIKAFDVLYKNCNTSNDKKASYVFKNSKIYNRMKACIGWGLWHDKNRKKKKDGCKDNDTESIAGYERFIQLHDANPPKKKYNKKGEEIIEKWYGLTRESAANNLKALKK